MARGLPTAKTVVYLAIVACFKQTGEPDKNGRERAPLSPYREIVIREKELYSTRTHTGPCPGGYVSAGPGKVVFAKCKVDGRYADIGDPFSAAHIHAIGFRRAAKALLNDIYDAAKETDQ